jgi:hypothetical protein
MCRFFFPFGTYLGPQSHSTKHTRQQEQEMATFMAAPRMPCGDVHQVSALR